MSLTLSICVLFISLMQSVNGAQFLSTTSMGFLQTTDQLTTYHQPPTNRPTDHLPPTTDQLTTDQVHRPPTNRPSTNWKYEDQKFHKKF